MFIDWLLTSASLGKRQKGLDPVSCDAFGQSCDAAEWDWSLWFLFSLQNMTPLPKNTNQGKPCRGMATGRQEREREVALCTAT